MAFTRPVLGADISAADFGQPVFDGMRRSGFIRVGVGNIDLIPGNVTPIPLTTLPAAVGNTWGTNATQDQFTCPVDGVYSVVGTLWTGNTIAAAGVFAGIQVDGLMRNRFMAVGRQAYETLSVTWTGPITVGQAVRLVGYSNPSAQQFQPIAWPGQGTDSVAPLLAVWRVSI